MPYVKQEVKDRIELPYVQNVGELTYVIDRIAEDLAWKRAGYDFSQLKYEDLAAVRGAISNAADEFYRRVIVPFEDAKIRENGDVFIYPHPEVWEGMGEPPTLEVVEAPAESAAAGVDVA